MSNPFLSSHADLFINFFLQFAQSLQKVTSYTSILATCYLLINFLHPFVRNEIKSLSPESKLAVSNYGVEKRKNRIWYN